MKTTINKHYAFTRAEVQRIIVAHIKASEADDVNAGYNPVVSSLQMEGTAVPDDKEALWLSLRLEPVEAVEKSA